MPTANQRSRRAAAVAVAAIVAALALGGCEREEPDLSGPAAEEATPEIPGGADPAAAAVIEEWSSTLSSGDVAGAARLFAIPSVAENGPALIRIRDIADARLFNASLPCGARLVEATQDGDLVVATFELSERPGGACGSGAGETAQTAFRIEDGRIVEWLRVATEEAPVPGDPV